jgi:hypothetical protein
MLSQVSTSTAAKIATKSAILGTRIDETAAGLQSAVAKRLHSINKINAAIIVDYVASLKSEVNLEIQELNKECPKECKDYRSNVKFMVIS